MAKHSSTLESQYPGASANAPKQIPAKGWFQVAKRAWKEGKEDQVPLLAAGVAFYGFLALFPTLIAAVTVYGLVADPKTVSQQSQKITQALPPDAAGIITGQLKTLASAQSSSLTIGLVVSLLLALWSASSGIGHLMMAVNIAYDEDEGRGFVKRKALALVLTLGAIVFFLVAVSLVAVFPVVIEAVFPSGFGFWLAQVMRWLLLVAAVVVALGVVFRIAPHRDAPQVKWLSVGAVVATVLWIAASIGFSFYVSNFGSYSKTYGALAGVAILMLWLWISSYIVLLGAEINAEAEQQTVQDSTRGEERPLGERDAVKADSVPGRGSDGDR
jgi:membrane protein